MGGGIGRGLRRAIHSLTSRFLPAVPFECDVPHKGAWEPFTAAQDHLWRRYSLKGEVAGTLTCVVLSDLHVGSHAGDLARLERIVGEIGQSHCHLLLLPGDFVNMQIFGGGRIRPEAIAEVLSTLTRRVPAVAVLGNHDAEYGTARVAAALEASGIHVLFNDWRHVETEAGHIHVSGLEDHATGRPDAARALSGIRSLGNTLVLAHDPASFAGVPTGPIATVCGHTHGGQICLPFVGPLVNASDAPLSCTHGHILEGGRNLIVSAGLGTSGIPLRVNCPPELVEITIEPQ